MPARPRPRDVARPTNVARPKPVNAVNALYYGDNLPVLRSHVASDSVDLVYLDPPFNSNRNYNILFKNKSGVGAEAQIQAFGDTWTWGPQSEAIYDDIVRHGAPALADTIEAMRKLLGENDMLAYLVMMAPRIVELHRVLKPTGTIYLHCDATAGHYLKLLLDAVFGIRRFLNEIIWHYQTSSGAPKAALLKNHDLIFRYAKGDPAAVTWNAPREPWPEATLRKYQKDEQGRIYRLQNKFNKRYYIDPAGKLMDDVWDITLTSRSAERLGYPTQKPLELLERIILASSNPGDLVLDPFCGCGTTVDAAQKLDRRWLGIDITFLAIDLIDKRLRYRHGDDVAKTYKIHGIPRDKEGAFALFSENPFDFERWAVSLVHGQPNEKQVGDKGIDGVIKLALDRKKIGKALVSVKGGKQINPAMVRDLVGTVKSQGAELGVLITMTEPTSGMRQAASAAGTWTWDFANQDFPKVQILTVAELLSGKKPDLPPWYRPYVQAKAASDDEQLGLEV